MRAIREREAAVLAGRLRIDSRREGGRPGSAARKAGPGETQEDGVSNFGDLEKKAEAYAKEHPEQADKGMNEISGIAESERRPSSATSGSTVLSAPRSSTSARTRPGPGAQPELGAAADLAT